MGKMNTPDHAILQSACDKLFIPARLLYFHFGKIFKYVIDILVIFI
jgi:hypothetical protein